MHWFVILVLLCAWSVPYVAQEDAPQNQPITLGQTVTESITNSAFFDWWVVYLEAGQTLVVEMVGQDGLAPLVALLDEAGDVVTISSDNRPPYPNGLSVIQHTAPTSATYRIVATRDGTENGTTTGAYTLTAFQPDDLVRQNPNLEAEFRCGDTLIQTALELQFQEDVLLPVEGESNTVIEFYRVTVFGMGDFQPMIRAFADIREERLECTDNAQSIVGSRYTLPNEAPFIVTDSAERGNYAQLALRNTGGSTSPLFGKVTFTIGSKDGQAGRFLVVLEGLQLHHREDTDAVQIRLGPLVKDNPLQVYMVGMANTRLDPYLQLRDINGQILLFCDDAGRFDCADTPSFESAGAFIPLDGGVEIVGDRLDAGLVLQLGNSEPYELTLASRERSTSGPYALFFVGELGN